jgi:hypothetical protein
MFPPDETQIQDHHNKTSPLVTLHVFFCLHFNIRSTIYSFVFEWYNLQTSNPWIRFVVHSCSSHPLVLAARDKWTISRAPVEHAEYVHPSWLHTRTFRCPNQQNFHVFKNTRRRGRCISQIPLFPECHDYISQIKNLAFNIHFHQVLHNSPSCLHRGMNRDFKP